MTLDLNKLEELARSRIDEEDAGQWTTLHGHPFSVWNDRGTYRIAHCHISKDKEFIAAVDPATVFEMISLIRRQERELQDARLKNESLLAERREESSGLRVAIVDERAAAPAPVAATDISRRLRTALANCGPAALIEPLRADILAAADEIERYYTGMMNWKRAAEAKDAALAAAPAAAPTPEGYALVPLRLTRAMEDVLNEEWQWEDLLAAAEAITPEQYDEIAAAAPIVQPVAMVDAGDDGMFASILPDRSVKVGQYLYASPSSTAEAKYAALYLEIQAAFLSRDTERKDAMLEALTSTAWHADFDAAVERAAIASSADEVKP